VFPELIIVRHLLQTLTARWQQLRADPDAGPGAGYGAVWGATRSGINGAREQEQVFKRCMRGRGYQVLN
jgi:hypothetical protein